MEIRAGRHAGHMRSMRRAVSKNPPMPNRSSSMDRLWPSRIKRGL